MKICHTNQDERRHGIVVWLWWCVVCDARKISDQQKDHQDQHHVMIITGLSVIRIIIYYQTWGQLESWLTVDTTNKTRIITN